MRLEPDAPIRTVMHKKFTILANLMYDGEEFRFDDSSIPYSKGDMENWARYSKNNSEPICGWHKAMTKANQVYKIVRDR